MKNKKKKRHWKKPAVLCTLCMLFVVFSTALTVNATSTKLTTSAVTAEKGDVAKVTLALDGNTGIWGLKIKVDYDHSALTLQSVETGNIFEGNDVTLPSSLARESFVFVAASNELKDNEANGSLVTLNFLVEKDAKAESYPITAEVVQAINLEGKDVKIDVKKGGSVTVNDGKKATASPEPDKEGSLTTNVTDTGDNNNPVIWIVLIVVALVGGGACCYALQIQRRRKGH